MKKSKLYIIGILLSATSLVGCSDFLLPLPNGTIPEEDLWDYPTYIEGFVGQAYTYMPVNYSNNRGFYFDGATDDAVITSLTHTMNRFGSGTMNTSNDAFVDDIYTDSYLAIVSVNRFLEDDKGLNTRYSTDEREDYLKRNRLQGEAFGLRAWFEWELLKYYGGVGATSGEMMGISILTDAFDDVNEDVLYSPRSTYEESVAQIQKDCDSAFQYLAVAHRDHLKEDPLDVETGAILWGCIDQMGLKAMLSDMYLTYASPLYNPTGDSERWRKAAEQALEVVDLKLEVDGAYFDPSASVNWNDPNFMGIIFPSNYASANLATELAFYPASVDGNGSIGATQELVDAFPMANGYPIDDPRSAYDPQNPYEGRDPRLYSAIFYNGADSKVLNTGTTIHTFEAWKSEDASGVRTTGEDYAGNVGATLTNLYIKKYIYMNYNPFDTSKTTGGPRSKYFYRWAHMLLNFAEAANEAAGPTTNFTFGSTTLSAKDAIALLRNRTTYDGVSSSYSDADPYLDEVASSQESFREFVRNERRIETCFEGLRFFDLRRWSTESDLSLLNATVHRPEVTKDATTGEITYSDGSANNPHVQIGQRVFTTPYLPIPYNEILIIDEIEQNKGWDTWM